MQAREPKLRCLYSYKKSQVCSGHSNSSAGHTDKRISGIPANIHIYKISKISKKDFGWRRTAHTCLFHCKIGQQCSKRKREKEFPACCQDMVQACCQATQLQERVKQKLTAQKSILFHPSSRHSSWKVFLPTMLLLEETCFQDLRDDCTVLKDYRWWTPNELFSLSLLTPHSP